MNQLKNLIFFGTSPRSAVFLEKAIKNGLKFDLVVSEPAKPFGRKKELRENPTVIVAKKFQIPYFENFQEILTKPQPEIGLIFDFNKIVPENLINYFKKGIINIHFSKLPQYRGPAPVQYTVLNGDKYAWITYLLISPKLDQGKIIFQSSLELDLKETSESLYLKLIDKATEEIKTVIEDYLSGKLVPQPQTGTPSYTQKLTSQNCQIDWKKTPQEIERLIRAAFKEPGAWTSVQIRSKSARILETKRLKILKAHLEDNKLVLDQVQLEGKKPVNFKQFLQGYPEAKLS